MQVQQQNYNHLQPYSDPNVQQRQQLCEAGNGLQLEADAQSELQQCDNIDLVQKAESVMTKVTTEAINLMRCQIEKKVQYLNIDYKVQKLYQQDGIARMRSLEIQMENEGLSQEKDKELRSNDGLALR